MAILSINQPEILADASRWYIVYKPPGWLTIPGRQLLSERTPPVLIHWLREKVGEVWTVHRLDRETSGLLLFARSKEAHREANIWFQKHQVRKVYDCIAQGTPQSPVFRINQPIEGAPSVTQVEVKDSYLEGFLARVTPVTGRRHQIRAHLSQQKNPLWGDTRYGGPNQVILQGRVRNINRVALHASRLLLPDGQIYVCDWPEDFSLWVNWLQNEGYR